MKNRAFLAGLLVLLLIFTACGTSTDSIGINGDASEDASLYDSFFISSDVEEGSEDTQFEDMLALYFLDVGQGDCILIETPDEEFVLIDSGTLYSKDIVLDFLTVRGVSEIEYVFFTHPHADHIGAADEILNSFMVGTVYMPNAVTTTQVYGRLMDALEENEEVKVIEAMAGQVIELEQIVIEVLSPMREKYSGLNLYSIVLMLTYGERSFLFTGDAEVPNEEDMLSSGINLSADVLKVGHHGSVSSTSKEFLAAVNPLFAIICCGEGNRYGHPHEETLQKLEGITTYRTDTNGTITVFCDGSELFVVPSRQ